MVVSEFRGMARRLTSCEFAKFGYYFHLLSDFANSLLDEAARSLKTKNRYRTPFSWQLSERSLLLEVLES